MAHTMEAMRDRILTSVYRNTLGAHVLEALQDAPEGLTTRQLVTKIVEKRGVTYSTDDVGCALKKGQRRKLRCPPGMQIVRVKESIPCYRLVEMANMSPRDREAMQFSEAIRTRGSAEIPSVDVLQLYATKFLTRGEKITREGTRVRLTQHNRYRVTVLVGLDERTEAAFEDRMVAQVEQVRERGGRYAEWIFCMLYSGGEEEQRKRIEDHLEEYKLLFDGQNIHFVNDLSVEESVIRYLDVMYQGPTMEINRGGVWEVRNPGASIDA